MSPSHPISASRSHARSKVTKTRRSRTFWIKTLKDFSDSGFGVQHFCALKKLSPSSFYAWRKRLQGDEDHTPAEPARFIPFDIVSPLASPPISKESPEQENMLPPDKAKGGQDSGVRLHINENFHISIGKDFHGPTLQRLVKVLTSGVPLEC